MQSDVLASVSISKNGRDHAPLLTQEILAKEMRSFLEGTPLGDELAWTKESRYLYHFEASRMLVMRELLVDAGFSPNRAFQMLDFGFLHGLTQEFLHRFFHNAQFTVCDLPTSPIFKDEKYLNAIRSHRYLELIACNIDDLDENHSKYEVVMLGEIIEHLDPTQVARALTKLRKVVKPGGVIMITTPNGGGLGNNAMNVLGHDIVLHPPIPDGVHGYRHIHLWPISQLQLAAEHFGWKLKKVSYYHGREGELFERSRQKWSSLKHQVMIKSMEFLANRFPKLRGFYVATFIAT